MKLTPKQLEPMNINGREFDFEPPIILQPGTGAEVNIQMPDGRASIIVRCVVTQALVEARRECQVIEDGERSIIVAAPSSIERPKLSWKIRLLRWLAKG